MQMAMATSKNKIEEKWVKSGPFEIDKINIT